jgi:hypothetical protein
MTPAQLKALLEAATKRPWTRNGRCVQASPIGDVAMLNTGGNRKLPWMENREAIVATMNAADALVALWEAAIDIGWQPDAKAGGKRFNNALRRLEGLP